MMGEVIKNSVAIRAKPLANSQAATSSVLMPLRLMSRCTIDLSIDRKPPLPRSRDTPTHLKASGTRKLHT